MHTREVKYFCKINWFFLQVRNIRILSIVLNLEEKNLLKIFCKSFDSHRTKKLEDVDTKIYFIYKVKFMKK